MNFEYKHLLNPEFSPGSKVWVYQSSRLLTLAEALETEEILDQFVKNWLSHGVPVKGSAHLFFAQFIILMADEEATGVSGCSTDSSVRMIKEMEQRYQVNLFDRTTLAFIIKEKVELLPISQVPYAFDNGFINPETLYFNNLVQTKEELENDWIVPVKNSWLRKRFQLKVES